MPLNDFDSDVSVLSAERLLVDKLGSHLLELFQALLELLTSRRVLSAGCNQLHRVQPGLLIQVVQQLNDLIKLVEVVDLNLALLELG